MDLITPICFISLETGAIEIEGNASSFDKVDILTPDSLHFTNSIIREVSRDFGAAEGNAILETRITKRESEVE
jgi:hypothetical protein